LLSKPFSPIEDGKFEFENERVRVVIISNCPKIDLAGLKIGPFEEGKEYEVRFWVAQELEKIGVARLSEEELMTSVKLHKIHWKERVQPVGNVSSLPSNFYPQLRRHLAKLKKETEKNSEKRREYEKNLSLFQDIINCRLKKIVSLSSLPPQTNQILRNLTKEERLLYDRLHDIIGDWRTKMFEEGRES
jgi:hypothetical protein